MKAFHVAFSIILPSVADWYFPMITRRCLSSLLSILVILVRAMPGAAEPVPIIFDTDMGNDVDDAMALSMIHALQSRGECRLLAVTVTKDNRYAGPMVDLLNTFYGRGDIPIGTVRNGFKPDDGKYLKQVVTAKHNGAPRYEHALADSANAPDAVALLRTILSKQPDASVVMIQVGFSTNLARLLSSSPDDVSPLGGVALVDKKVRLLSIMAGTFSEEGKKKVRSEYNILNDLPAAITLHAKWPTPIVASGWEIGDAIMHPAQSMREDYQYIEHHPLVDAYHHYRGLKNDQPTFDLTSVLYAVRPNHGYFTLSPPGRIVIEADGHARFDESAEGPHRFMSVTPEQIARVREAQAMLCSQPPDRR